MKKSPIDWFQIEALMLKSFTGGTLYPAEQDMILDAYNQDPTEYSKRNLTVKTAEIERIKKFGS